MWLGRGEKTGTQQAEFGVIWHNSCTYILIHIQYVKQHLCHLYIHKMYKRQGTCHLDTCNQEQLGQWAETSRASERWTHLSVSSRLLQLCCTPACHLVLKQEIQFLQRQTHPELLLGHQVQDFLYLIGEVLHCIHVQCLRPWAVLKCFVEHTFASFLIS